MTLDVGGRRGDRRSKPSRSRLGTIASRLGLPVLSALLLMSPATVDTVHAEPIFQVINVADTTPGEDLWRYVYTVDGSSFGVDQGVAIFFDYTMYGSLLSSTPDTDRDAFVSTNSDWDILLLDPEIGLLADGVFDALALVGSPITNSFSVDFLWLGVGTPGSQPFYTYQLDAFGTPQILQSGVTTAAHSVPEPGTLLLLLVGGASVSALGARRRLMRPSQ